MSGHVFVCLSTDFTSFYNLAIRFWNWANLELCGIYLLSILFHVLSNYKLYIRAQCGSFPDNTPLPLHDLAFADDSSMPLVSLSTNMYPSIQE